LLDSKLASKLRSLHRDNPLARLNAKLGNNIASKLVSSLGSSLATVAAMT